MATKVAATMGVVGVSKKFECQRCERRFVRREHLQRHERSHTKEKPFSCAICTQAFTRRDLLVRHNRLNHTTPDLETEILSPSPSQSSSSSRLPQLQGVSKTVQDHDSAIAREQMSVQLQTQSFDEMQHNPYSMTPNQSSLLESPTTHWHPSNPSPSNPPMNQAAIPSPAVLLGTSMSDPWYTSPNIDNAADFSSFLDSIALPSHQFSNFFQFEQPLPYFSPDPVPHTPVLEPQNHVQQQYVASAEVQIETPKKSDSFTQFGSRLPSLQPEDHVPSTSGRSTAPLPTASHHRRQLALTNVTVEARAALVSKLDAFAEVVPSGFTIVSRHALSRYITGFVSGFHEHLPFLHIPTMCVEEASLELVLALAAIGAQYCREAERGLEIFKVAKAVCVERVRRRDQRSLRRAGERLDGVEGPQDEEADDDKPIETAQALLILMAMATWFERRPPAREAPAIRSLLETLMRDEGLKSIPLPDDVSWATWIAAEGAKRTKFIVFAFFNLHSIVFDIPPMILSGRIDMDLPCMESEWKAPTEAIWRETRKNRKPEPKFLQTFTNLFRGRDAGLEVRPRFSSLGSYILIHALIQHIWLTQELFRGQPHLGDETDPREGHLPASSLAALEGALKNWQHSWERNPESSVDPLSPHGPLSFNSTALLRLAYIRINIDTGPIRSLGSCNPAEIAASIRAAPPVARSKRMTRAALHCAHSLSIPIKLGINSIAHTRLFWSIQHALCSLECALLLTKWLESVTPLVGKGVLSEAEERLLGFVVEMVAETEWAAPAEELLRNERRLSAVVVRVWARLFRSDDIWEMVDVIGRSLEVYADMLES